MNHINFALVEDTRPPMYTAMKYWGKKPHNIWKEFIENYCPSDGVVLDPFVGSGIAAFEAVKAGRKVIATDLNPLSSFVIEVLSSRMNKELFMKHFNNIKDAINADEVYRNNFIKQIDGVEWTVYNYKWEDNCVKHVAMKAVVGETVESIQCTADEEDLSRMSQIKFIEITDWYPNMPFPNSPNIKQKFVDDLGGNSFENLWTRRNLYILSKIFSLINQVEDQIVKKQLLFGFIQSLHLSSKMVVPRNEKSNRDFSGSWGRADYMIRRKSMEQNPMIVFERSCIEKQGVISSITDSNNTLPDGFTIANINERRRLRSRAALNYGILDVADITDFVPEKSVDFIITDPPYAGLVPYLDLSMIWLVWLSFIDDKYIPDLNSEITIKEGLIDRAEYKRRMTHAFRQLHKVLKEDGYLVITFHHKKIQEWNDFIQAVRMAGFKFDKVTHQYNRRSGESNVSNPYGTSGADFYIRCVKYRDVDFSDDVSELKHFILQKTIEIIGSRAEPTPFTFIVSGLIPEMLQAGYFRPNEYQDEISKTLLENTGNNGVFTVAENKENGSGDYWWFQNPSRYVNYPDLPLNDRVEETVVAFLRRRVSVQLDDVLSIIFRTYPNGLTPDPRNTVKILEKYAYKSSGKWKIKPETITSITKHTQIIEVVLELARKARLKSFVGKREQPEKTTDGSLLSDKADYVELSLLSSMYNADRLKRIEMIDSVIVSDNGIEIIFEVENSTGFMSAIQRASNIGNTIPKIMVIPDQREVELNRINDPLFKESFKDNNWRYITYTNLTRLKGLAAIDVNKIMQESKELN